MKAVVAEARRSWGLLHVDGLLHVTLDPWVMKLWPSYATTRGRTIARRAVIAVIAVIEGLLELKTGTVGQVVTPIGVD